MLIGADLPSRTQGEGGDEKIYFWEHAFVPLVSWIAQRVRLADHSVPLKSSTSSLTDAFANWERPSQEDLLMQEHLRIHQILPNLRPKLISHGLTN